MFAKRAYIVNTQPQSPLWVKIGLQLDIEFCSRKENASFDGSNVILLSRMHSGQIFKDMKGTQIHQLGASWIFMLLKKYPPLLCQDFLNAEFLFFYESSLACLCCI